MPPRIVSPPPEPLICWGSAPFARRRSGPGVPERAAPRAAEAGRSRASVRRMRMRAWRILDGSGPSRGRLTEVAGPQRTFDLDVLRVAELVGVAGFAPHAGT